MAVPTSYTETELAEYAHATLGAVALALDWSVPNGNYDEIVNDSLLAYGETDISLISGVDNIKKLRVLTKLYAWRAVAAISSADFDFSADGGRYSRSQIHAMALEALDLAEREAGQYDPIYRIGIDSLDYKHDPYKYRPEDERTLP